MSGFAGFSDYGDSLTEEKYLWMALARRMARRISHRGPDDKGAHVSAHCALAHVRLSVVDPENGAQPMTVRLGDRECTLVYNGELMNAAELRGELEDQGYRFHTESDTEVVLNAYLCYGPQCAEKLLGMYAFAVDDTLHDRTFFCRDRMGVKPLFYCFQGGRLAFGSEIKALFEFPGINPVIKREGLCQVLGLGPFRTPGCGVFDGIFELKPGHTAVFDRMGFREKPYFQLEAYPHSENYESTVSKVLELLEDAVKGQLRADAPLCAFLSGGPESFVAALGAQMLSSRSAAGGRLSTYSLTLDGPPESGGPFEENLAEQAAAFLHTDHTTLVCDDDRLADSLFEGVIAKDLPGMPEADGALLYFARHIKKRHTSVLCGEGTQELFGGSPWYRIRELYDGEHFPWSGSLSARESLLLPELREALGMGEYVEARFREALDAVPALRGESSEERRMRELTHLTLGQFLPGLWDRLDRCGSFCGVELRTPFADHRLVQYLCNTPWEYKCPDGAPLGLLRDAAVGLLPERAFADSVPSTAGYSPGYTETLLRRLTYILRDSLQPIHKVLSRETVQELLAEGSGRGNSWSGRLMAGPQLPAYLIQINYWLLHYSIYLDL